MEKICIACSMPMKTQADFAMADTNKDYCYHCANNDGTMKTYKEVLDGSMTWAMENFSEMGFEIQPTEDEMHQAIKAHMSTLPAWKNMKEG